MEGVGGRGLIKMCLLFCEKLCKISYEQKHLYTKYFLINTDTLNYHWDNPRSSIKVVLYSSSRYLLCFLPTVILSVTPCNIKLQERIFLSVSSANCLFCSSLMMPLESSSRFLRTICSS